MKRIATAAALLMLGIAGAVAQTTAPTANPGPGNNAVNQPGAKNPGAPVAGANSFTEAQAKSRMESSGFSNVSNLTKDASGIWRASATKDGKQHSVSLDFQGNVVAQ